MGREIIIRELPQGDLATGHFELRDGAASAPLADGEVRLRTILISIDAANRAWMQGATYRAPVRAGDVMPGYVVGEVIESRDPSRKPGDLVGGEGRWADELVVKAAHTDLLPAHRPVSHLVSLLGIAGKTAWHGLVNVGFPRAGETVVVSAAAGSVGIFVGQIAKALGCRAVGIAGGADKCAWLVDELGFDAAVDYRGGNLFRELKAACPAGIDIYFDNVGGQVLETVLFQMNQKGRVVCCGAVSQYNATSPSGPRNLPGLVVVKRLRMEGFIVMDFADRDTEAEAELARLAASGQIRVVEDIVDGLENAPQALVGLLAGENRGKRMVRVGPDPR